MTVRTIGWEVEPRLDWIAVSDAIAAGHALPRAVTEDGFLRRGGDTILNRAAWIDGLGALVKTATVFPGNARAPTINGAATLFDDGDGTLAAIVDFHLLTKWKTAADSLLAARRLAPAGVGEILIVGAGTVARSLRAAYGAAFPEARFRVWNRSPGRAEALAGEWDGTEAAPDLQAAVGRADIVACATMSTEPVLRGDWLRPGQHVDLIGAYRADMREADDAALARARVFVDSRPSVAHIGEIADPVARGVIAEGDVVADFYELDRFERGDAEITLFKNGGGAHLDLMVAAAMLKAAG